MVRNQWLKKGLPCALAAIGLGLLSSGVAAQSAKAPDKAKHHFSLNGSGKTYQREFEISEVDLSSEQSEGRYTVIDDTWQPGMSAPPHFHKEHAETFYIISGRVEWTVGGETHEMTSGDLVFIPPNTVHSVKVLGDRDAKVLFIYDPAGFEDQLDEMFSYSEEERQTPEVQRKLMESGDFTPAFGR